MDLKQNEQEGIDDFAMKARKKHQRIDWNNATDKYNMNDLTTCATITRGTTNANIREYCLSRKDVPDLDVLYKGWS